jgi:hypothetical protein
MKMARPLSADTDEASEAVHLDLLRSASIARRTALAFSLTRTVVELARRGLARLDPGASESETAVKFVAVNYGQELAEGVRQRLSRRPPS